MTAAGTRTRSRARPPRPLEVEESKTQNLRRWWRVQRAGWLVMLAALIASTMGALGGGSSVTTAALRGAAIYIFLMVIFRFAGRRTLASMTNFDAVLLIIIAEAVQNALVGQDDTLTTAFILVTTLVLIDVALSLAKRTFPSLERALDGAPTVLVRAGREEKEKMDATRVEKPDILAAAREKHGIASTDEIEHAVLEATGEISIIPKRE